MSPKNKVHPVSGNNGDGQANDRQSALSSDFQ